MALSRRRFLAIAAATGCAVAAGGARAAGQPPLRWHGQALGTNAQLTLHGAHPAHAAAAIGRCLGELARLERVFSLYDPSSALSRLNAAGYLDQPPAELVACFEQALRFGAVSGGAFDVTVQPLWDLYARHYATAVAGPPSDTEIADALARVGQGGIALSRDRVVFHKAGMAVTLNGIAQGYITDRIADLLRGEGFTSVLVDMGEIAAVGRHPDGSPWRVALDGPGQMLDLRDLAVSTSSGAGTPFSADGRDHHLFDPHSGRSANRCRAVSVVARDATTADALSTAAAVLPPDQAGRCLAEGGAVAAYFLRDDGDVRTWRA